MKKKNNNPNNKKSNIVTTNIILLIKWPDLAFGRSVLNYMHKGFFSVFFKSSGQFVPVAPIASEITFPRLTLYLMHVYWVSATEKIKETLVK